MENAAIGRGTFHRTPVSRVPAVALTLDSDPFAPLERFVANSSFSRVAVLAYERLELARLALSAIGPSSPMFAGMWFVFDDPDFQFVARSGLRGIIHEIIPSQFTRDVQIDPGVAADVVSRFLKLDTTDRERVRLALDRLNLAVRRHRVAEQALELGIALETLLTDDNPGENTFKLGLRAALLAGPDLAGRTRRRAIVGALYRLRSAVSHSGTIPSDVRVVGVGKMATADVMSEALSVVAETIRAVIVRSAIPEWYAFELGGQ
jgi:hypothetical protein